MNNPASEEVTMKQVIRKCSLLLMFTLFLAVFVPVSAHAAKTMTVTVNGEENNRITLNKGDKVQITVQYGERILKVKKPKYKSSKKAVAKVTKKGVIKAKSEGKATIRVKYKGQTKKIRVTVVDPDAEVISFSSSSAAGKLTCSSNAINTGEVITVNVSKKARARVWTWEFSGTAGKDGRILNNDYQSTGKITFTVWPSGGTLTLKGTDPSGAVIGYNFKVTQSKKWAKREAYRTDALAGLRPGMSKKDMVVYFADYIADRAKYGPGQGNFFRVIDKGVGDCWCYSTAFKLLADAVGIETIIVKNALKTSHYWNQVNIDGVWYNVDAQGYDTGKSHNWILSSDKKHGSRWLGDATFSSQFGIHYPVSPAHVCNKTLKF